jgi:L-lactate dehydrogenase
MNSGKVAIIGVGYVGASITYALTIKGTAREIVLIEHPNMSEKCNAEINDIRHGIPFMGTSNIYNGDYSDIKDCDLIIITAGRNRKQGEKRSDLKNDNLNTARQVANEIKKHYTKGVVLVVTNPVDTVTREMSELLDLPNGVVFGSGCLLDSSRFVNIIADYVEITSNSINAHIVGEHGEGQIALWSKVSIAGIPIANYCKSAKIEFTAETKELMEKKVLLTGAEIIKGKGRTHYGIATCVCYIADAILNHRPTIVSVSSVLKGEYGINDVALSLPCVVSSCGVERRLADKLNEIELFRLSKVAAALKTL